MLLVFFPPTFFAFSNLENCKRKYERNWLLSFLCYSFFLCVCFVCMCRVPGQHQRFEMLLLRSGNYQTIFSLWNMGTWSIRFVSFRLICFHLCFIHGVSFVGGSFLLSLDSIVVGLLVPTFEPFRLTPKIDSIGIAGKQTSRYKTFQYVSMVDYGEMAKWQNGKEIAGYKHCWLWPIKLIRMYIYTYCVRVRSLCSIVLMRTLCVWWCQTFGLPMIPHYVTHSYFFAQSSSQSLVSFILLWIQQTSKLR